MFNVKMTLNSVIVLGVKVAGGIIGNITTNGDYL